MVVNTFSGISCQNNSKQCPQHFLPLSAHNHRGNACCHLPPIFSLSCPLLSPCLMLPSPCIWPALYRRILSPQSKREDTLT